MKENDVVGSMAGTHKAALGCRLPSVHGRTDYVPVALKREKGELLAFPIFGKSASISILVRSDGYVIVPEHVEGLDTGSEVSVHLYSH
jgi:molybdopterin molybdotransferase